MVILSTKITMMKVLIDDRSSGIFPFKERGKQIAKTTPSKRRMTLTQDLERKKLRLLFRPTIWPTMKDFR
jgi:hypothetical protein